MGVGVHGGRVCWSWSWWWRRLMCACVCGRVGVGAWGGVCVPAHRPRPPPLSCTPVRVLQRRARQGMAGGRLPGPCRCPPARHAHHVQHPGGGATYRVQPDLRVARVVVQVANLVKGGGGGTGGGGARRGVWVPGVYAEEWGVRGQGWWLWQWPRVHVGITRDSTAAAMCTASTPHPGPTHPQSALAPVSLRPFPQPLPSAGQSASPLGPSPRQS